jgi:HSP20 family protein
MATITRWNPVRDALTLREAMNRLLEDSFVPTRPEWSAEDSGQRVAQLPVDAYTTENEIVVTASVPGLKPEDVEIVIEGETLTIRGEMPGRLENADYLLSERFHGPFARKLQLNVPVDLNGVEASFENGILTLVLPKAEEVKPKVIKVKSK